MGLRNRSEIFYWDVKSGVKNMIRIIDDVDLTRWPRSINDSSTVCWDSDMRLRVCGGGDGADCGGKGARAATAALGEFFVGFWGRLGSLFSSRSLAILLCSSFPALAWSLCNILSVRFA